MEKSLYSAPDAFSLSPLLALLSVRGDISELSTLVPSFYARYEKVQASEAALGSDHELKQRVGAEKNMLRQLLEHHSVSVEEPGQ